MVRHLYQCLKPQFNKFVFIHTQPLSWVFLWGRKMPLPDIQEFAGSNITQRKFQQAQGKLLDYVATEVPTKVEMSSKANKADVDTALSNLSTTANKYYSTLAAANADIMNIALNQSVTIGEEANSGLWEKKTAEATSLTRSPYDPVQKATQEAKTYTDQKALSKDKFNNIWDVNITLKQFDAWSPYSVGFVGLKGKMPFGIRKDGVTVAQKMITDDLETKSQTIADVKFEKLDPFTGYIFGIGNGFKFPFLMQTDGSIVIDKLKVNSLLNSETKKETVNALIKSTTQEWWISPVHSYVDFPYPRVVSGVYSEKGEIVVSEYVVGAGTTNQFVVGSTPQIDDHNAPSLWLKKNRRALIMWTQHSATSDLELKVSSSDADLRTLEYAPVIKINVGERITYTQLYHMEHLSDAQQDTFWVFSRLSNQFWNLLTLVVDQDTGNVTLVSNTRILQAAAQYYATTSQAGDTIRIASGFNPAASQNFIVYHEIDIQSGDIKTANGILVGNVLTNQSLPIVVADVQEPALPQTLNDTDRRLHYVRSGPCSPAIAYAEWPLNDPNDATYKIASFESGAWIVRDVVKAGKRFGYNAQANYISGISFPTPCLKDEVLITRYDNDTDEGVLERAFLVSGSYQKKESLRVKNNHLLRPISPVNGGNLCMYTQLYEYGKTSAFSFVSDIKSIFMG